MNTTENNKIIAEFMGFKLQNNPNERFFNQWLINTPTEIAWSNREKLLFFDCDWNWLMAVVLKINMVDNYRYTVQINSMDTYIHDLKCSGFIFQSEMKWQSDELINSVYEAVVEFIKWYNENKLLK